MMEWYIYKNREYLSSKYYQPGYINEVQIVKIGKYCQLILTDGYNQYLEDFNRPVEELKKLGELIFKGLVKPRCCNLLVKKK